MEEQAAQTRVEQFADAPADADQQPHHRIAVGARQPLDRADTRALAELVNDGNLLLPGQAIHG